jgi:hypothetical protein
MSHLELPLGLSFKAQGLWNVIIEKLEKRSTSWKKLYFSKVGELSLFIELFRPQGLLCSLGRAFGDLRLPLEWRFSLG